MEGMFDSVDYLLCVADPGTVTQGALVSLIARGSARRQIGRDISLLVSHKVMHDDVILIVAIIR